MTAVETQCDKIMSKMTFFNKDLKIKNIKSTFTLRNRRHSQLGFTQFHYMTVWSALSLGT